MSSRRALVVNAGGVTLKLSVVDGHGREISSHDLDPWDGRAGALDEMPPELAEVDVVAHRVVHGGTKHTTATLVDDDVVNDLADATPLAPRHQPRTLTAIGALRSRIDVPHVACFDTTFHRTIEAPASTPALPAAWRERWPLATFGFHGYSHANVATRAPSIAEIDQPAPRIVSCHLASGSSLCAIDGGRSVDTTMGMTPLDGLPMATRPGSLDPGLVMWLVQRSGLAVDDIVDGFNDDSGLRGLAGGTGDLREVVERRDAGDDAAILAYDVLVHRLRREIGAMVAVLGGADIVAFTGGIGQNMAGVRADALAGLQHLGLVIDEERNDVDHDALITSPSASIAGVVVTTDEHSGLAAAAFDVVDAVLVECIDERG